MTSGQAAASRTRDEVADAIRTLSVADLARLKKIAGFYSNNRPVGPKDLLQMAYASALDGRTCPAHVGIVKFLAQAMRSIADGEIDKTKRRVVLISVAKTGDHQSEAANFPDPVPTAEEWMVMNEDAAATQAAILSLFDDDPQARDIVEGTMEGMTAEELRQLTGLDETAYASKRKLIRRRIDKAYPEGWKP